MNTYHTKATARELGFTFVADSKTNWLHLAKDKAIEARCNSRFNVYNAFDGSGYDFECIRCNKIISKVLAEKTGA